MPTLEDDSDRFLVTSEQGTRVSTHTEVYPVLKYPPVSSNMAGWKIFRLNGGVKRTIIDK